MFTAREQTSIARVRALQTILPIYMILPDGYVVGPN